MGYWSHRPSSSSCSPGCTAGKGADDCHEIVRARYTQAAYRLPCLVPAVNDALYFAVELLYGCHGTSEIFYGTRFASGNAVPTALGANIGSGYRVHPSRQIVSQFASAAWLTEMLPLASLPEGQVPAQPFWGSVSVRLFSVVSEPSFLDKDFWAQFTTCLEKVKFRVSQGGGSNPMSMTDKQVNGSDMAPELSEREPTTS